MPTVFLSFAREDLEAAKRIARQLAGEGVTAWRDQEQLYAGQNWPKALGEAIAASNALLLLWSSRAAESAFVELEWSTAVALKKSVLPCLLDQTPLPPLLSAIEAAPPDEIVAAARKFLVARAETKRPGESHTKKVVDQLEKIGAGAPVEVLRKAKAVFAQSDWTVQGSVYQAGGDIHIGTPPPRKTRLERWQAWVAIVAGILTAVSLGLALVRGYLPVRKGQETPAVQSAAAKQQLLAGQILDDSAEPLANVKVSVLVEGKVVATGTTDSRGLYSFRIDGSEEAEATLLAQKDGYPMERQYPRLGDTGFTFKMRRKQP